MARVDWAHRLDRLDVAYHAGPLEARLGRQAISWATTLLLTPADPFAPFDPSDPFREYRVGVDAARLRYDAGPFTEIDLVVRPAHFGSTTVTALARAKTSIAGWDASTWAGTLYDQLAAAFGIAGSIAGSGMRAELELRSGGAGERAVGRAAAGLDRRVSFLARDLYGLIEYQHDGYGAARAANLPEVLMSAAAARAELQVLGRDVVLGQASYQVHPLVSADFLVIVDARDGSALFAPAGTISLSDDVTLRVGSYLSRGDPGTSGLGVQRSDFGAVPATGYVALTAFF